MSTIAVYLRSLEFGRTRTLLTLDEVARQSDPQAVLGYRPGPGRAHIGWQLAHIAITEELFATERLFGRTPPHNDLVPRFKGGSVPDDDILPLDTIRELLTDSRSQLLSALSGFTDQDLGVIPDAFKERGWTLERILQVLVWHEAHHQGQAHLTLNLWKQTA